MFKCLNYLIPRNLSLFHDKCWKRKLKNLLLILPVWALMFQYDIILRLNTRKNVPEWTDSWTSEKVCNIMNSCKNSYNKKKKNRTFVRSLDITLPYRSKCLNLIKLCLDSTSSSMNLAALLKQGTFGFQTHEHLIKLLDKYIFSLWQKFFIHFFVMTRYTLMMNSENWPCIY